MGEARRLLGDDLMRTPIERAVREKLDGLTPHATALHVTGENGCVILTGDVLTDERALIVREAATVEGVDSVVDLLDEHREHDGIAALAQHGPQLPTVPRMRSVLARTVHPALRLAAAGAGLGAMASGLRLRGTAGVSLGIVGGLLFAGGAFGASGAGAVADVTRLRRVIELDAAVVVHAPAEDVFATFRAMHHAPRFLRHLRGVERRGANLYRWSMDGASGSPVSWDVEITAMLINRRMSWKSVRGARVRMTGDARFQRLAPDTTRVLVHLTYALPFGRNGRAIRALFGDDPDLQLAEDLQRFAAIVEEGGAPDTYRESP